MGKKLFGNSSSGGRFSGGERNEHTAARQDRQPESAHQNTQSRQQGASRPQSARRQAAPQPQAVKTRESRAGGRKEKKPRNGWKALLIILAVILCLELLYCVAIFSNIPFIARLRSVYIETAMSTMSHHWLAEAFIPKDIIDEVEAKTRAEREAQAGINSNWGGETKPTEAESEPTQTTAPQQTEMTEDPKAEEFYELFWEIDRGSMEKYLKDNPQELTGGWDKLYINEAGLDDKGTPIQTIEGDQILAIDVPNQILLIRVKGSGYQGVLAIMKKQENLHLYASNQLGVMGQPAGRIAEAHDGVLACTGSGFIDEGGGGNGGRMAGYCMADGEEHGSHFGWGYKRLELREDNRFYITDAYTSASDDTTDAMEFWPAMIVDGQVLVNDGWTAINPRCSVGQTENEDFMMLVVEGRLLGRSMGTDVVECANIMKRYGCYQAMNMDGGTSAIMWYDGEYVTLCSNENNTEGRYLPNAWVYTR